MKEKRGKFFRNVFSFLAVMLILCLNITVSAEMFSAGESSGAMEGFGAGEIMMIPEQAGTDVFGTDFESEYIPVENGTSLEEMVNSPLADENTNSSDLTNDVLLGDISVEMEGTATLPGIDLCVVTYYAGDGSKVLQQIEVEKGTVIVFPDFVENGYKNLGWSSDANSAVAAYPIGGKYTIEEDTNFFFIRVKMANAAFYSKTGKTSSFYQKLAKTVEQGTTIIMPELREALGYEPIGWSLTKGSSSVVYTVGQTVTLQADTAFYAVYKNVGKCNVKFNNNSGTSTSKTYAAINRTVTKNSYITLPTVPKASGYINLGWTTVKKGTTALYKAGDRVQITKGTKFYAVRKKSYKVYLYAKSGKLWKTVEVAKNSYYELPGVKNKNGYTMLGWTTKKGQGNNPKYEVGEKIKVVGNTKLYSVLFIRSKEKDYSSAQLESVSKNLSKKYNQVIFVGDSRTDRTEKTLKTQGYSASKYKVSFIAKGGQGLSWFKKEGYPALLEKIGSTMSNNGKSTAVIFNLGVNDLNNISSYISYMKKIAPTLKERGCELYYMSVNPVNNVLIKYYGKKNRPESQVRSFNSKIKTQLCGASGGYNYIDTYSWLVKYGYGTDANKYGFDEGKDDGLHYTVKTTKRIFRYCINTIN